MSKSFMDAIKSVVKEGAREKTADGMTKDAAHFRHDLHKVQDAGFKHMVQKDSETSDYAKMFSGDVEKAPDRLGDQRAPEDLNKYVEYNEHLEIEEAKKAEKHDEDCDCEKCSSDEKEEVKEDASARIASAGATDAQRRAGMNITQVRNQSYGKAPTTAAGPAPSAASTGPNTSGPVPTPNPTGVRAPAASGKEARMGGAPTSAPAPKPAANGFKADYLKRERGTQQSADIRKSVTKQNAIERLKNASSGSGVGSALGKQSGSGTTIKKPAAPSTMSSSSAAAATPKAPGSETAAAASGGANPAARNLRYTGPDSAKSNPPKPKMKPAAPQVAKAKPSAPKAAAPKAAAPQAPKPSALQQQMKRSKYGRDAAVTGPKRLNQSFEIEINGTSYLVSESHAAAIATFVEKHGMVNEVLTKSTTAGETISDFVHSDNPKFKGKSKKKRMQMALAAYYDKQREK